MTPSRQEWNTNRAEDTALQRCNRSAVPGAETEVRAASPPPKFPPFGISAKAQNLRGTTPRLFDRMSPPQPANANQPRFQFTLNQDRDNRGETGVLE
jgi:hypothetical protein